MLLSGSLALGACASGEYYPPGAGYAMPLAPGAPGPPGAGPAGRPVAILLPLTGERAELGQSMLQAAQLVLGGPGGPPLIPADTGGSAAGAATAARGALGNGAGLILGPLTAPETAAVTPVAAAAGVPVLAFTNDAAAARPGVWPLGITPGQQVGRLVEYGQERSRSQFAALLPDTAFGHAMGDALAQATVARGLPAPTIRFHGAGMAAINAAARDLSEYATRWAPIQKQIKEAKAAGTPEGRREAERLSRTAIPPPPFDALLLGATGDALAEATSVLQYYFVTPPAVQFMGPALWASPASGSGNLRGAWYAAPDPAARAEFEHAFTDRYGVAPPGVADLAYDGAMIARATASAGYGPGALTAPNGFMGADGWLRLLPDGHVQRGLAVFRVEPGGPSMIAPAPTSPAA